MKYLKPTQIEDTVLQKQSEEQLHLMDQKFRQCLSDINVYQPFALIFYLMNGQIDLYNAQTICQIYLNDHKLLKNMISNNPDLAIKLYQMIYKESKIFNKKSDQRRNFQSLKVVFETLGIRSIMQPEEVQIMVDPTQEGEDPSQDLAQMYQMSNVSDEYENQSLSSYFSKQNVVRKRRHSSVKTINSLKISNEKIISIENTESPTRKKKDEFDPF